ncbi:hypothetical protein [Singulisphaera sp. PoT]|uniref:hypothetical protein n=1 Tax=Singulisphaera sp. PoT TaxID=3411797 RepID=UPI003BF53F01
MQGRAWIAVGLLAVASGCRSGPSSRSVASSEPPLAAVGEPGTTVIDAPPPRTVTWVDRHPLFSKPRQYYESSGDNKVVKTAAATVIGIPAGVVGELKQIVVGTPAATAPPY